MSGPLTVEIQTIEGGRLEWVGIFRASGERAEANVISFGEKLIAGFRGKGAPQIRIVDKDGNNVGGWGIS